MSILDERYPAVTKSMLTWFIAPAIVGIIVALALVLGVDAPPAALVLASVVGVVLSGICVAGFLVQYRARQKVRNSVISCDYDVAICYGMVATSEMRAWAKWFLINEPFTAITDAIRELHTKTKLGTIPFTFITLRAPGKVLWKWNGMEKRARGTQKGNWCEIEWSQDKPDITTSLALHKLAHVVLMFNNPGMSESTQHNIMVAADINSPELLND